MIFNVDKKTIQRKANIDLSCTHEKLNIAISLVNLNGFDVLKLMLDSLLDSDIIEHNIKLFYWDNGSIDGSVDYVKNLNIDKVTFENRENFGIVIPRIRIMDDILSEKVWDNTLEIHSDMIFPKKWFNELAKYTSDNIAIVMPYIFTSKEYVYDRDIIEKSCERHFERKQIFNCLPVHPWLLNNKCIKKIGYYRPDYGTHRYEDTDLVYRVYNSKYSMMATKTSFVYHKGGFVRKKMLKWNKNEEMFKKLNSISSKDFCKILLSEGGHPKIHIEFTKPNKGGLILDIGCGHDPKGDVNIDLYPFDRTQCAFSWNPQKVKNFIISDGCQAPFRDKIFDKVYSSHVIEHVEIPLTFLKECKRLSRREVLIRTPSQFDITRTLTHIYTWNPHTLKMLMTKIFSNVETGYTDTGPLFKRGRKLCDWFPFLPAIFSKMGILKEIYGRAENVDLLKIEKEARSEKPLDIDLFPIIQQYESS